MFGPTVCLQPLHPGGRLPYVRLICLLQFLALCAPGIAEGEQAETITFFESAKQRNERGARLPYLLTRHRPRDIDHHGHVPRLSRGILPTGSEGEHDVSCLSRWTVGSHRETNSIACKWQEHRELPSQLLLQLDHQATVSQLLIKPMRRRERIQERVSVFHHHTEIRGDPLGGPGQALATGRDGPARTAHPAAAHAAGVPEVDSIARARQQLSVAKFYLPLLPRIDREDPCPQEPVARQFDERRIGSPTHDLLVYCPRAVPIHHLAAELLLALPDGKPRKRGLAGEWVQVFSLRDSVSVIPEPLRQHDAGYASRDRHSDPAPCLLHRPCSDRDRPAGKGLDPPLGVRGAGRDRRQR